MNSFYTCHIMESIAVDYFVFCRAHMSDIGFNNSSLQKHLFGNALIEKPLFLHS